MIEKPFQELVLEWFLFSYFEITVVRMIKWDVHRKKKNGRDRMKYGEIEYGIFHQKRNRFIAEVYIHEQLEEVHIKNTGRLKELLIQGAKVVLEESQNPNRKTKYSLIAVWKNDVLVNIDSQAPNVVVHEALEMGKITEIGKVEILKREVTYGGSRFDFYYEKGKDRGFIEVKGVTLEEEGVAKFPDAPTVRGAKHVRELMHALENGYKATILFVVQMKGCKSFIPNLAMDKEFSEILSKAAEIGVEVIAYDAVVTDGELVLDQPIPVNLP